MFCEYCGKRLEAGWKTCPYCGGEDTKTSDKSKKMKYTQEIQKALVNTNANSFIKKVKENGGNILDSQISVSLSEKIFIGISFVLGFISIRGWNILPCIIIIVISYGCASLYSNKTGKIKNFMFLWLYNDDIDCSNIILELSEQEIQLLEEIRKKKTEQIAIILIGFIIVFVCWVSFGVIVSLVITVLYIISLFTAGNELKKAEQNWNYYFLARSAQEEIKRL